MSELFRGPDFGIVGGGITFLNILVSYLLLQDDLTYEIPFFLLWINVILFFRFKEYMNYFIIEKDKLIVKNSWLKSRERRFDLHQVNDVRRMKTNYDIYVVLIYKNREDIKFNMGNLSKEQSENLISSLDTIIKSNRHRSPASARL